MNEWRFRWVPIRCTLIVQFQFTSHRCPYEASNFSDGRTQISSNSDVVCLSCKWWKRYFFHHFPMFFIIFNHANACASMCSLVEIHNIQIKSNFWIRLSQVIFIFLMIQLKLGSNIKHFKITLFFTKSSWAMSKLTI